MLLMGMSNPDLPQSINFLRSRNYSSFADLEYLFHNFDLKTAPEISSELFDETKRHLALELTYVFDEKAQIDVQNGQIPTSETKDFLNTLRMNFEIEANDQKRSDSSYIMVNNAGIITNKKKAEDYLEKNSAAFLSADLSVGNPANDLVDLAKWKKKDIVTEQLAKFDKHITSVEILNNMVYVALDGVDKLLPINMMGDGLRRYLNIVAAAANPINNIILFRIINLFNIMILFSIY